ncbi:TetR family transcriptional regulator [Enterobacterales bacterium CwR94]|nr:TetR family transcriptional regulator [Enterobacterales bacterium CwR94]
MNYLNKDQRKETILLAAMNVALAEGFMGMTVRRIAQEAHVSVGQLHHHYASIGELKSLAFVRLIRAHLTLDGVSDQASWRGKLLFMLGGSAEGIDPYIRLWREAQILAANDADMRDAYWRTLKMWHLEVVHILQQGIDAQEFRLSDDVQEVTWRMMAFVCGLDGIVMLGMPEFDERSFDVQLEKAVAKELLPWSDDVIAG